MFRTVWAVLRISLVEMTAYRTNLVIWSIIDAIFPLAMIVVWLTVYQGQTLVGDLTQSQMLTYYVGVLLVTATVSVHHEWDIQRYIRSGQLKMYLTKPLPFFLHMATEALAWRLNASVINIPLAIGMIWVLNDTLGLAASYPLSWQFWLALLGSLGIFMSMSFVLGYCMFFLERISGIIHANDVLRALTSGALLPLGLFPTWIQTIIAWLPYKYQFDFPIQVLIGTISGAGFWQGLFSQGLWTAFFGFLSVAMWQLGIRRYDAPEQVGVAGTEA